MFFWVALIQAGIALGDNKRRKVEALSIVSNWDYPLLASQDWLSPIDKLRVIVNTMTHGTPESRRSVTLLESTSHPSSLDKLIDDLYHGNQHELENVLRFFSSTDVIRLVSNQRVLPSYSHFDPIEKIITTYARQLATSPVYRHLPSSFRSKSWLPCTVNLKLGINSGDPRMGVLGVGNDQEGHLVIQDMHRGGSALRIDPSEIFPSERRVTAKLIPGLRVWCLCDGREARMYYPGSPDYQTVTRGLELHLVDLKYSDAGNCFYAFIDSGRSSDRNLFICSPGESTRTFEYPIDSIDGDVVDCLDFEARPIICGGRRGGSWPDRLISNYLSVNHGLVTDTTDDQLLYHFGSFCSSSHVNRLSLMGKQGILRRMCESVMGKSDDALSLIKEFIKGHPYSPDALKELFHSVFES